MLGKYVRVKVTHPIHSHNAEENLTYDLNYGQVEGGKHFNANVKGAYIMGISHPVRSFDGRVIAVVRYKDSSDVYIVVAPKSTRFINIDVITSMAFVLDGKNYTLECLYERSCGAVVFREIGGMTRFLLIKNKRSAHWGFPKGHVEMGETDQQTAFREVLEETGIHIKILPGFVTKSQYSIQGKVEKSVSIYLASTEDTNTVIQKEEIEDYVWLGYERAKNRLKFENDHAILDKAIEYIAKNNLKG